MSAMDDKNTIVGPSALERLPAELQLMILGHLPAKQIQLNRRISQQFRSLLDLPENQRMCTRNSVKRSLDRLGRRADFYCNFSVDTVDANGFYTAFWDLLEDFTRQHGFLEREFDPKYHRRLYGLAELWLHRRSPSDLQKHDLSNFLGQVLFLHGHVHMPYYYLLVGRKFEVSELEEEIREVWGHVKPLLGPSGSVDVLLGRVHSGIFPVTDWYAPAPLLPTSQRGWPEAEWLTEGGWPIEMSPATRSRYYDQAYATLATVFGVPAIPGWMPLHYCLRDAWAPGDDLSAIKHAAMLEGMDLQWR